MLERGGKEEGGEERKEGRCGGGEKGKMGSRREEGWGVGAKEYGEERGKMGSRREGRYGIGEERKKMGRRRKRR